MAGLIYFCMLSAEEVKHIARLARIGIDDAEAESFRADLSNVLDSFRELERADVSDVEAFDLLPGRSNSLRDDTASLPDPGERERLVSLFPHREGTYLRVKSVFS